MTEDKNKVGRPTSYTLEIGDKICQEIVLGYSLRTICKDDELPCVATIFNWFRMFPEFLEQYEIAKAAQADTLVEEMLDIADDGSNDWMEKTGKDGESTGWMLNGEHVQRSRLRLDARKWIASKLKAKKYGDSMKHTGDKDNPINIKMDMDITSEEAYLLLVKGKSDV